jgi:hypothetical protein
MMELAKKGSSLVDLEKEMLKLPQVEAPLTHNFAEGVYVRELFIPKDTWIMGKRHRYETCNILLKGKLSLYMGKGVPAKVIEAPLIFNSKPGTKKFAFANEDTIFLNIHPTSETDVDKIEQEFIISEDEFNELDYSEIKQIERGEKCLG